MKYKIIGGDKITRIHNITIDNNLHNFLIGSKLGDGCFIKKSNNHNTYITFSQCENQLNYLEWKFDFLNQYNCINKTQKINQLNSLTRNCFENAQKQFKFSTKSCSQFNYYKLESRYKLIKELGTLGICVLILDDGNIYNGMCKISCPSNMYSDNDIKCLYDILYNKFNVQSKYYQHPSNNNKNYISINKTEFITLKQLILDNIQCDYTREKVYK